MRRSVRNGLAIAGMAGGMLFLGQAVASADDADQTASATNTVTQESGSTDGGDLNVYDANLSGAEATNVQRTEVSTDVDGGDGGINVAAVNTGVIAIGGPGGPPPNGTVTTQTAPPPPPSTTVDVTTGDVTVNQSANGGDVSGSGNAAVSTGGGDQTATATNTVTQTSGSTDGGDLNLNINISGAEATNVQRTEVNTDVDGGDGGLNVAAVNTGVIAFGGGPSGSGRCHHR